VSAAQVLGHDFQHLGIYDEVTQADEGKPHFFGKIAGRYFRRNQAASHHGPVEGGAPLSLLFEGRAKLLPSEIPLGDQALPQR
jgi:hypothetical protein